MDEPRPLSLAQRLMAIGIPKSHAYKIANNERTPSLELAVKIRDRLGIKLGPIANATDAEIDELLRLTELKRRVAA